MTTRTPLHAAKLLLRLWLTAMWLILQSDKGISSIRLAEALGVSQPTAWQIGHAVRLMLRHEGQFDGIVETDEFYIGGSLARTGIVQNLAVGEGQPQTTKTPALTVVQRPLELIVGASRRSPGLSVSARNVATSPIARSSKRCRQLFLKHHLNEPAHPVSDARLDRIKSRRPVKQAGFRRRYAMLVHGIISIGARTPSLVVELTGDYATLNSNTLRDGTSSMGPARLKPKSATFCPAAPSSQKYWRKRSADIGRSKTACNGCSR